MKGGIQNCRMCGKGINTFLKTIGTGSRRGHIESEEGIMFEGIWFCNQCWSEIIGEEVHKPFKIISKKLPKKLNVPETEEEKERWLLLFDEPICIIEINENIRRVFNNKPLTRPLATLNKSCKFKEKYNIAFNQINEDKIKKINRLRDREYMARPETKEMLKAYYKKYNKRPEVIERKRKYRQEYRQRPEVKEKRKEYYQRPEVKEKFNKYYKEYYQRPEVKQRKKENQQKYYQKNKKRIREHQKEHRKENKGA